MEKHNHTEELTDLGAATVETKGQTIFPQQDLGVQARDTPPMLSAD